MKMVTMVIGLTVSLLDAQELHMINGDGLKITYLLYRPRSPCFPARSTKESAWSAESGHGPERLLVIGRAHRTL